MIIRLFFNFSFNEETEDLFLFSFDHSVLLPAWVLTFTTTSTKFMYSVSLLQYHIPPTSNWLLKDIESMGSWVNCCAFWNLAPQLLFLALTVSPADMILVLLPIFTQSSSRLELCATNRAGSYPPNRSKHYKQEYLFRISLFGCVLIFV